MSMAERVARKACLFAPLASRYTAKKIEAIEPKRVPTAPAKKLASGRSTARGWSLPSFRGEAAVLNPRNPSANAVVLPAADLVHFQKTVASRDSPCPLKRNHHDVWTNL